MEFNDATTSRPAPQPQRTDSPDRGDTIEYRNYTNMSGPMRRCYQHGDTLVAGWTGTIAADTLDVHALAEKVYEDHNHPERPDGQLCPSLSVGDVVIISETAVAVADIGFAVTSIDPADVVTDMTYREFLSRGPVVR